MKKILLAVLAAMNLFAGFTSYASIEKETVQVWGTPISPFVRKVVAVLEHKHIPYHNEPVLPVALLKAQGMDVPQAFQDASPLGKIPAITYKEFSLADSSVIVAFLEKNWCKHPVYPKKAKAYAQALWFEKYADTTMTEVLHPLFVEQFVKPKLLKVEPDQEKIKEALAKAPTILNYLESSLVKSKGKYLVGDDLTIADIAVIQHFIDLKFAEVSFDMKDYPLLEKYLEKVMKDPCIKASLKNT
ncbi:MAG: glutathione S-transferase [Chlamydiales bacterium]|jgi:glutathione S-transferase|nr:glutathione S-transferase [Chlamydiales bacterium]